LVQCSKHQVSLIGYFSGTSVDIFTPECTGRLADVGTFAATYQLWVPRSVVVILRVSREISC